MVGVWFGGIVIRDDSIVDSKLSVDKSGGGESG